VRTWITLLAAFGLSATSCGAGSPSSYSWHGFDEATGQTVTIPQGAMPSGQSFTGVYRSPQIGDINLSQTGDAVIGAYEYDRGDCHVRATLEGSTTGNLFRFHWSEDHRQCGRMALVTGRGYFLIATETTGETQRARLWGRWGYQNDDRSGGPWTAFKIPGRQPVLPQSQGGGGEGSSGGESDAGTSGSGDNSSGGSSGTPSGSGDGLGGI
jgi:hypothetical protein